MKYEWKKSEKAIYCPKAKPEQIHIPAFKYIVLNGEGNPNSKAFAECITALYSVAYAIKMTLKKLDQKPDGYCDYTVYPLEGVWDINDEAKKTFTGTINKDDLVFSLMIRQPDFVDEVFYQQMLELTKAKKPNVLLDKLRFESLTDGDCIQMLHMGSYDNERESFELMEAFAENEGVERVSKIHREIYLNDFRKVPTEKLKTVLRFKVK